MDNSLLDKAYGMALASYAVVAALKDTVIVSDDLKRAFAANLEKQSGLFADISPSMKEQFLQLVQKLKE